MVGSTCAGRWKHLRGVVGMQEFILSFPVLFVWLQYFIDKQKNDPKFWVLGH